MISATGKRKGFTFIEILFVIIIIGVLISFSFPNLKKNFNSLQLKSFSRKLQSFMGYLCQRSVVEIKPVYLDIDAEGKKCWAKIKGQEGLLQSYSIPEGITVEASQNQVIFYPDGSIDTVTVRLVNTDGESIILTTKGVLGGVKLQSKQD